MPEDPLAGPLLEAHFDDEKRLDPHVPGPRGHRAGARRLRPARRREAGTDLLELGGGESRAHPAGVGQPPVHEVGDVKSAESSPAALRLGVSHHHEIGAAVGADLEPPLGAPGAVGRVGALGDDPFEPQPLDLREQGFPALVEMLRVAQRTHLGDHLPQQRLALHQGEGTDVVPLHGDEIERVEGGRMLDDRAIDLRRA
jgi:hypothetical protein